MRWLSSLLVLLLIAPTASGLPCVTTQGEAGNLVAVGEQASSAQESEPSAHDCCDTDDPPHTEAAGAGATANATCCEGSGACSDCGLGVVAVPTSFLQPIKLLTRQGSGFSRAPVSAAPIHPLYRPPIT